MIRLAAVLLFLLGIPPSFADENTARVELFSPQGEVKGVRQVTARFTTPMVPFGDPALVEPFEVLCAEKGQGRWADSRNWVFDFEHDLPAGARCSFTLKTGVTDMEGRSVPAARFEFTTGGPSIRQAMPWDGQEFIDENQVFILGLDAPATDASVQKHVWCNVSGRAERVPVRIVSGKERKAILDRRKDFLSEFASGFATGSDFETFLRTRAYDKLPLQLVACQGRLPYETEVQLVWGAGVETPGGVAASADQSLAFKVRPAFTARFSCQRTNAKGNCIPVLGMALDFTAPVAVSLADKVQLKGRGGEVYRWKISDDDRRSGFVNGLHSPGPFPEASTFTITLPEGFVDDGGRSLSNAKRFPLSVKTDPAPPLAKFAARFGVLELNAEPALPVTLRNVEKELAGKQVQLGGAANVKGLPARMLKVQSPRDMVRWLKRLNDAEARWTEGGYVSHSIFGAADATSSMTLPKPGTEKEFEVVGIPFKVPGFYVVEIVSPRLGQALLKDGKPYYVSAGALVTNLAVHFKWGREGSLVWVTSLDKGEPVPAADVSVLDCTGRVLFEGVADKSGIARIRKALPERGALPGCVDKWDQQLFVTARKGDDAAFVLSGWDEGIATWRFNLRSAGYRGDTAATTVFDRTLLRAGDTLGMKHILRRRTATGFGAVPVSALPVRAVVRHWGSGQMWELPLKWDGSGAAESAWQAPKDAKLGEYSVILAGPRQKSEAEGYVNGLDSGSFRVEEFRVPVLKATVQMPAQPLVNADAAEVSLQLTYLSGGGAGGTRVKLRAVTQPHAVTFDEHEGVSFASGDVREGRMDRASGWIDAGADAESADPLPDASEQDDTRTLKTQTVVLDGGGAGKIRIDALPRSDVPRELVAEMEYADPNGQILTRSSRVPLWPSGVLLGIQPDGWALSKDKVKLKVISVDTRGKPLAGVPVVVDVFERISYAHRKRLIGGFYAYEYGEEIRRIGGFCEGRSDAKGLVHCEAPVSGSGNLILRAKAADASGNPSFARADVWVAGQGDWWFDVTSDDRMDVLPERKRYEPGETAVVQVRSPFREASALVTVEREGVVDGFVTTLTGKEPVVRVPIKGHYAPNTFVSVFAVRGRVAEVQPTALVDLGKPAFRMGVAEIRVGWRDHELAVKVSPEKDAYRIREKARVTIEAMPANGKPLPKGAEVAVAAVDEALLELLPNGSWKLLEAMMQPRGIEVNSSTSAMQVIGKRHYGKKALPAGGGGGRQTSRELFDTLLLWKARVKLDAQGRAQLEVPLNDSLSSFRIVAVATAGLNLFGTGSASVRTSQDVTLLSGLPPVVREQDRYAATFTVRNASEAALDIAVEADVAAEGGKGSGPGRLEPQTVRLAAGESANVSWLVTAPAGSTGLQWSVAAKAAGAEGDKADRLKARQKVVPAVPVRVLQATLAQIDKELSTTVALPAEAIPGRGEVAVQLQARLGSDLPGVRDWMERYPYSCLEQRVSKAVALRDEAAWRSIMSALPAYIDHDGLLKYFAGMGQGSDSLTAYVMAIAHEAQWSIPESILPRLQAGLGGFVNGTVVRHGSLPTADLAIRKVAALEALSRYGMEVDPAAISSFDVAPNLWPTSAVIDWYGLTKRWEKLPDHDQHARQAEQILRSRLNFQGTTMGFSTERTDFLWWLMISGDVNANRVLLAMIDEPAWREDMPRLVRGSLGRQQHGRWNTTVANAWGVLALEKFGRAFESEPVSGATAGTLGGSKRRHEWTGEGTGRMSFEWPAQPQPLTLTHEGAGKPWATLVSRAALPLKSPFSSGYRITRTVSPVEGDAGQWKRGDIYRVRLAMDAQSDMTWVVVEDPIPAGATILGSGLGGDSGLATRGEKREGWVWPAFEERGFEAFRAYYEFVPKGAWTVEYTVRMNNAGTFQLPPTRVEAMYAPEMFGEVPNTKVTIGNR